MRIRDLFTRRRWRRASNEVEFILSGPDEDVEVAGESYHREAFARIFTAAGCPLGGTLVRTAAVIPEPTNPHSSDAVAVYIEGLHVGYIPSGEAPRVRARAREQNENERHLTVPTRIWASSEDGIWRARVTLLFSGRGGREWSYVDLRSPPGGRTPERLTERARLAKVRGAQAAAQVDGWDFASLRPDIAQAKEDGDLQTALGLLLVCVDAAERRAKALRRRPSAWPTEQAAVVLQRLRDYNAEIDVLERFIKADPAGEGTKTVRERLARVRSLAGRPGGS